MSVLPKPNPLCVACGAPLGICLKIIDTRGVPGACESGKHSKPRQQRYLLSPAYRLYHVYDAWEFLVRVDQVPGRQRLYYDNPWKKGNGPRCQPLWRGIPVHIHCWAMIERVFGVVTEENLENLVASLRHVFPKQKFEVARCMVGAGSNLRWIGNFVKWRENVILTQKERLMPVTDPIDIRGLPDLIKGSKKRKDYNLRGHASQSRIPIIAPSKPTPLRLPLDIQFAILDHLTEWPNTTNALAAFHWQLPESYWKLRLPRKILYEFDELLPKDQDHDLGWKYLCLGAEKLMATSYGLLNRQRIFRVLEGARDHFLASLEAEE